MLGNPSLIWKGSYRTTHAIVKNIPKSMPETGLITASSKGNYSTPIFHLNPAALQLPVVFFPVLPSAVLPSGYLVAAEVKSKHSLYLSRISPDLPRGVLEVDPISPSGSTFFDISHSGQWKKRRHISSCFSTCFKL